MIKKIAWNQIKRNQIYHSCFLWQQIKKCPTLSVVLNDRYCVWWERPSNCRPNLFPILLHHQPLYFCSSSFSCSLLLIFSLFLTLFLFLYLWMYTQWTWIIFAALLKAPLNGEIPNATASCSHITHFTATDAGSVSSNTQRCRCIKINLWWTSQAITEKVEQQINIQSKKICW